MERRHNKIRSAVNPNIYLTEYEPTRISPIQKQWLKKIAKSMKVNRSDVVRYAIQLVIDAYKESVVKP